MELEFSGSIFQWRGPAPFYYVAAPPEASAAIRAVAPVVTYGWGVIPVWSTVGDTRWYTALFPKDGAYLVPLKAAVRRAERLSDGDAVAIRLELGE